MNIREMIRETIESYFNMNDEERKYVEGLLDDKKAKWKKCQLIIVFLIFKQSKKMNRKEIKDLELYIEDNMRFVVRYINECETEYKNNIA